MPVGPIAYLYSRYPVISQTFCDAEMAAMVRRDFDLHVASIYPPKDSFRHGHLKDLVAPLHYPPPPAVLKALVQQAEGNGSWPEKMIDRHASAYGPGYQPHVRARNALYFAHLFKRHGIRHVHVHFANRATITALFLKHIAGIPFSFTPHAQDFLVDLGNQELLAEMCAEAEFVIAVSNHTRELLRNLCPASADKVHRVYNGINAQRFDLANPGQSWQSDGPIRIISVGRLIEFKGFQHLINAVAKLRKDKIPVECRIVGEGPWQETLQDQINEHKLDTCVTLLGAQPQEKIRLLLKESDVFALPCIVDRQGASDILPTVITEAMASGLPIVSTHLAGIPEMVDDGISGLLTIPGDEDATVASLKTLYHDRDLAQRMGIAARRKMEETFDLPVTSGQLADHFNRALAQSSATTHTPAAKPTHLYLHAEWPCDDSFSNEEMRMICEHFPAWQPIVARLGSAALPASAWWRNIAFFPDGIVLEAEWLAATDARAQLEALRTELGSAVDGEHFFREARRALWLVREINQQNIQNLHAARSSSALCAWLAHQLTGIPFSIAIERHPVYSPGLLGRIAADARKVSAVSPRDIHGHSEAEDSLVLGIPPAERKRFGPIRWKTHTPGPTPDQRLEALKHFLS